MNFASVLQGFVALLWIAVVGLIILAIVRAARLQSQDHFDRRPGNIHPSRRADHCQRWLGLYPA